jgi:hypothetical protein
VIALAALLLIQSAGAAVPSAPGGVRPDASAGPGIRTAMRACEQWLLEPATWAGDSAGFVQKAGLAGSGMSRVVSVPDVALPPPSLRDDQRHWRVPVGEGGVFVTTSQTRPFCHLAGGGPFDMQPAIQTYLASAAFTKAWAPDQEQDRDGLRSSFYRYRADPRLTMGITRAVAAGGPTDRVQLLVTAQYETARGNQGQNGAAPGAKRETGN